MYTIEYEQWTNKKKKIKERLLKLKLDQTKINTVHKLEEKIEELEENSWSLNQRAKEKIKRLKRLKKRKIPYKKN